MANNRHLAILLQGEEVWNAWRNENPDIRPDLRGAELSCQTPDGLLRRWIIGGGRGYRRGYLLRLNLQDADLRKADLSGSDFQDANLKRANLENCYLPDAELSNANFEHANLEGSTLGHASFVGTKLPRANLRRAELAYTRHYHADFGGANLEEARAYHADLDGVNFRQANLRKADLRCAVLRDCDLREADLQGANLRGACFIRTDLQGTDLSGSLIGSTLVDAVDLSRTKGLVTVIHEGPSPIGSATFELTAANATPINRTEIENFYLAAGVPESTIQTYRGRYGSGDLEIPGRADFDVRVRVQDLQRMVPIATDLRDAGLRLDEQRRLSEPMWVPLIRILHWRQLLEVPVMASALARPEDYLVPAVMLNLLDREGVAYFPEIRIAPNSERHWRRRWVESTGEAIAVLFLNEAILLDIPTLARIRERSESTPDFQVQSLNGEGLIFEAKGATAWTTHRRQRRDALSQLGKLDQSDGSRLESEGRAFGCAKFAAIQGDEHSSLLYVVDPPAGLGRLFPEGWDREARRHHFAAVLQMADQYEIAAHVLRGEKSEAPSSLTILEIPGRDRERPTRFLGVRDSVERTALRLSHPNPTAFGGVTLFRGVEETVFQTLMEGQLPEVGSNEQLRRILSGGTLRRTEGEVRGVFSLLVNGSILAIEVET